MNRFPSPENSDRSSIAAQLVFFSQGTAIAVIAIGIATICGWLFDLPLLAAIHPRFATMKANTALCFILSGMALGLEHCYCKRHWRWLQSVERPIAWLICFIALLTLGQYLTGVNFGIDELLIPQPEPFEQLSTPGRMAPNTAVAFLVVGFALVAMKSHRPNYQVVQVLASIAGLISFAGLMGYVYSSVYFYTTNITGMAFHAAIAFLLLSSGILCAYPDRGMARLALGQGAGSIAIRQLLPLAICLPPLVSGIAQFGYRHQLYSVEVEAAIAATLNVVIFVALIIRNALVLNRIDTCRQQIEARLAQLAAIVESSQDAIISQSTDGTILSWNAAAERMFGYRAQDTIGKSFCPIVPPEIKPDFHAILQRVLQGERVEEYEMQCYHQDGHRIEVAATISPIYAARTHAQGNRVGQIIGVSTIQRDITARKHLELQLQSLSQRLEFLLSTSPAVIFSFQPQFGDRLTYLSSNVTQVLGYSPHCFKNDPQFWQERVHPEDIDSVSEIFHQALDSGYSSYEYRFLHADGTYRWLHEAVRLVRDDLEQPLEIVGYLVDIGDRKQTELELLRSRDLREAVFNGSTDALFLVDPISLLTMDCNERAVELFEAENREALIQIEGHRLQKQPFTPEELE
ncbi:MAG: PAS domain S-box protein, partial [Desertifilum sp. SIO1I2]|nr:PAS domain S-box protein [Desertifilum sp. SIO1I2]